MGYSTNFHLSAEPDLTPEVIASLISTSGYDDWSIDGYLDTAKWYEHMSDITAVSTLFPDVKFELFCDGEDGEQWIVYAYQGKTESIPGIRTFAPRTLW